MNMNRRILLYLLIASIPLMGLGPRFGMGCGARGCGGGGSETSEDGAGSDEEVIDDSGVASSTFYKIPRADVGSSLDTTTSGSNSYNTTSTLGNLLSQSVTLSNSYKISHPMSKKVLATPASLKVKAEVKASQAAPDDANSESH